MLTFDVGHEQEERHPWFRDGGHDWGVGERPGWRVHVLYFSLWPTSAVKRRTGIKRAVKRIDKRWLRPGEIEVKFKVDVVMIQPSQMDVNDVE